MSVCEMLQISKEEIHKPVTPLCQRHLHQVIEARRRVNIGKRHYVLDVTAARLLPSLSYTTLHLILKVRLYTGPVQVATAFSSN